MSIDKVTLGASALPPSGADARLADRSIDPASIGADFEHALGRAAEGVLTREAAASAAVEQFVRGGEGTLHETLLAVDRSEISLKYLVSVRNKLIDAYHEIMRMGM